MDSMSQIRSSSNRWLKVLFLGFYLFCVRSIVHSVLVRPQDGMQGECIKIGVQVDVM